MIDVIKLLNDITSNMDVIKEGDIPEIDLYMDQVTTFMDSHLKKRKRFEDDKILTKTMINNYAKNELLPSPEKKKYSKDHVIMLIFIYYLKNILSINDIKILLTPVAEGYFKKNEGLSLKDLYADVMSGDKKTATASADDILKKIELSKKSFLTAPEDEREFLQLFTLVSSLCYDVYIKKQMIEGIVDLMAAEESIKNKKEIISKQETKQKQKQKNKTKE